MPSIVIHLSDELHTRVQAKLAREGTSLEAKALQLLEEFARSEARLEDQRQAGRKAIAQYEQALRNLAEPERLDE